MSWKWAFLVFLTTFCAAAMAQDSLNVRVDTVPSIARQLHHPAAFSTDEAETTLVEEVIPVEVVVEDSLGVERTNHQQWWVFLLAVFLMIVIGTLKNINPVRHRLNFRSYFLKPATENEMVEDSYGIDLYQITQILVSCMVIGWLMMRFQPFDLNFTMQNQFGLYLLFLLGTVLLYVLKYFLHYIVGLVLQSDRLSSLVVYAQSNMIYALALLLFPCAMIHYYSPEEAVRVGIEKVLLILFVTHFILRTIKSFRIYFEFFPYSRVYIFIYLCTLEILPLLVLVNYIGGV